MPRPQVYQATLESEGFDAPKCVQCHKPLDRVERLMAPYILEKKYEWDSAKAEWSQVAKILTADKDHKAIERLYCSNCGHRLTAKQRAVFYASVKDRDM